jgi:hypothetical protein
MRMALLVAVLAGIALVACKRSGAPPATAPATQAGDKMKDDLKMLGHDIKDAATQAATEVKPALRAASEKGRELIHEGAQKVADWTQSQPATRP